MGQRSVDITTTKHIAQTGRAIGRVTVSFAGTFGAMPSHDTALHVVETLTSWSAGALIHEGEPTATAQTWRNTYGNLQANEWTFAFRGGYEA